MSDANQTQIGGDHYKGRDLEHWDFIVDNFGISYLLANATKYISRWRNKNGVEDLKKARHYVQKLSEWYGPWLINMGSKRLHEEAIRFCDSYELKNEERFICLVLLNSTKTEDVNTALEMLDMLITSEEAKPTTPEFKTTRLKYDGMTNPFGFKPEDEKLPPQLHPVPDWKDCKVNLNGFWFEMDGPLSYTDTIATQVYSWDLYGQALATWMFENDIEDDTSVGSSDKIAGVLAVLTRWGRA